MYYSSVPLPPPGMDVRNKFRRKKELIHHNRDHDRQKATHGSKFHRLLLLYRTRVQSPMKVSRKERKQGHLNLSPGRKRQNSILGTTLFAAE